MGERSLDACLRALAVAAARGSGPCREGECWRVFRADGSYAGAVLVVESPCEGLRWGDGDETRPQLWTHRVVPIDERDEGTLCRDVYNACDGSLFLLEQDLAGAPEFAGRSFERVT